MSLNWARGRKELGLASRRRARFDSCLIGCCTWMNDLSRVRCFDPKLHVGQSLQLFGLVTTVWFDVCSPSSAMTVTSSLRDGFVFKPHIGSGFGILRCLRIERLQCDADLPTQQLFKAAAITKRGKSARHTLAASTATTQTRVAKRRILRACVIMGIRIFGGEWEGTRERFELPAVKSISLGWGVVLMTSSNEKAFCANLSKLLSWTFQWSAMNKLKSRLSSILSVTWQLIHSLLPVHLNTKARLITSAANTVWRSSARIPLSFYSLRRSSSPWSAFQVTIEPSHAPCIRRCKTSDRDRV